MGFCPLTGIYRSQSEWGVTLSTSLGFGDFWSSVVSRSIAHKRGPSQSRNQLKNYEFETKKDSVATAFEGPSGSRYLHPLFGLCCVTDKWVRETYS